MRSAMMQLNLSARGYHRVLKLTRTIADLAGQEEIQSVLGRSVAVPTEDDDGMNENFVYT
jgi:predicted ATPase with chaperone activity